MKAPNNTDGAVRGLGRSTQQWPQGGVKLVGETAQGARDQRVEAGDGN